MNTDALKAEIAKPEYAGMDNIAIAEAINAKAATVTRVIRASEVKQYLLIEGILSAAELYAQDAANDMKARIACQTVRDVFAGDAFPDIDPNNAAHMKTVNGILDELDKAGLLSADQRATVLALGQVEVPLWQTVFTDGDPPRPLDHGDIIVAKGERWDDYVTDDPEKPHEHNPKRVAEKLAEASAVAAP